MANALGATVIGLASSAEKAAIASTLGAHHTIIYGDGGASESIPDAVMRLTGGRGANVVYDGVGRDFYRDGLASLAKRGTYINFGNASGKIDAIDPFDLTPRCLSFMRPSLFGYIDDRADFLYRTAAARLYERLARAHLPAMLLLTAPPASLWRPPRHDRRQTGRPHALARAEATGRCANALAPCMLGLHPHPQRLRHGARPRCAPRPGEPQDDGQARHCDLWQGRGVAACTLLAWPPVAIPTIKDTTVLAHAPPILDAGAAAGLASKLCAGRASLHAPADVALCHLPVAPDQHQGARRHRGGRRHREEGEAPPSLYIHHTHWPAPKLVCAAPCSLRGPRPAAPCACCSPEPSHSPLRTVATAQVYFHLFFATKDRAMGDEYPHMVGRRARPRTTPS